MGPIRKIFAVATATAVLVLGSATDGAERHAGYYYPEPTSVETCVARASDLFREMGVGDFFAFFDMAKLFGFEQITVSDGDTFAHQVMLD